MICRVAQKSLWHSFSLQYYTGMFDHAKSHRSFLHPQQTNVYKVFPTRTSFKWDMKEFFLLQTLHILLTKDGEPYKILAKLRKFLQRRQLISLWHVIMKDDVRQNYQCSTTSFGRSLILMEKQISANLR
jgi:hypothetical protein